jgi:hypothetical protein
MTVMELMEILQDADPEAEVRFAGQPSWPFEYSVADTVEDMPEPDDEDHREGRPPILYLVEGNQIGYLPGHITEALGWGR